MPITQIPDDVPASNDDSVKAEVIVDRNNDLGQPSTPGTEVPSDSVGASSDTAAPVKRKKKRKKITVPSD